jgi:hypothetical protein
MSILQEIVQKKKEWELVGTENGEWLEEKERI